MGYTGEGETATIPLFLSFYLLSKGNTVKIGSFGGKKGGKKCGFQKYVET